MALTNAGRDTLLRGLLTAEVPFSESTSYICVGDSNAPFDPTQTDLKATNNKIRKIMDAGYPQVVNNTVTFRSTMQPQEGNFAWQEWGIANALTGGVLFNRAVEYNGTKVTGQTWVFEVTLTVTVGN